MFKLVVVAALLAFAAASPAPAAKPGVFAAAYGAPVVSAYSAPVVSAYSAVPAVSAYHTAPVVSAYGGYGAYPYAAAAPFVRYY